MRSMLRVLCYLTCVLASSVSVAVPVPTEFLEWRSRTVETGLERLKEQFLGASIRRDTEFVGAVLQTPEGRYRFTQGHGKPGQDQVSFRIQRPENAELIGFWHTHGAHGPSRGFFSPTDVRLVRQTGLPFYLITPEGEVRVLKPDHFERGRTTGYRIKGSIARLPRGSHPGVRVSGRHSASKSVMEV